MRFILIVAGAVLVGSYVMVSGVSSRVSPSANVTVASAPASAKPAPQPAASGPRVVNVERDRRGHFQVRARVDGRDLGFMVDTGASVVALTERDAAQIGVRPMRQDFTVNVSTANGTVKAARVTLRSVDINGLRIDDVTALILPDGALSENLLGLSYLSRLKRYEFAGTRLVMEQ